MNQEYNVLLIFCEGDHDTAYVRTVFRKVLKYDIVKLKFSEMPYPFSSLFETTVRNHSAEDMSLDMAHKFFLPEEILKKTNNMIILFKSGGSTKYDKIKTLLSDYLVLFNEEIKFGNKEKDCVKTYKYLFVFDLDANGIDGILEKVKDELRKIGGYDFIVEPWKIGKSDFGRTSNDKAVFVWGDSTGKGTLEDILVPMIKSNIESRTIIDQAEKVMSDMFEWDTEDRDLTHRVAELAKYKKSVITTAGQRAKPGKSLHVIIRESGLITEDALEKSDKTKEFVRFLNDFLVES
jgi:hypothetical protein